jgi:hypothetical protein
MASSGCAIVSLAWLPSASGAKTAECLWRENSGVPLARKQRIERNYLAIARHDITFGKIFLVAMWNEHHVRDLSEILSRLMGRIAQNFKGLGVALA